MNRVFGLLAEHLVLGLFLVYLTIGFLFRQEIFSFEQPPATDVLDKGLADNPHAVSALRNSDGAVQSRAENPDTSQQKSVSGLSEERKNYRFRPLDDNESAADYAATRLSSLIESARRLVMKGDFDAAKKAYAEAIRQFPDNPEPHGQLGNLYIRLGSMELAADAYYRAALLLHQSGGGEGLQSLLRTLTRIAPEKAQQLQQQIAGQRRMALDEGPK